MSSLSSRKNPLLADSLPALLLLVISLSIASCISPSKSDIDLPIEHYNDNRESTDLIIEVTLNEGTNLAVAVNPITNDKVLALQGTLYHQASDELQALAISQWYDDAWEPSISNDGSKVVYKGYRDGSFDLWQIDLSAIDSDSEISALPIQLTDSLFDDREPQYSPDDSKIIFSSDRLGSYDIWLLDLESGELRPLTQIEQEAHSPAWAADGQSFAYIVSDRQGSQIYKQNLETTNEPEIVYSFEDQTNAVKSQISGLQWLPDSSALSFRALDRDSSGNAYTSLKLLDLETGQVDNLSPEGVDVFPFRANWLKNGEVVYAADGKVQRLNPAINLSPSAESSEVSIEEFQVNLELNRTPYQPKQTDFDSSIDQPVLGISYPVISPDGETVAFSAIGDLWLWSQQDSELIQLTDDPAADQSPRWSSDGEKLVYISDVDGQPRIKIRDLSTAEIQTLALDQKELSFPSWSADGRKLAYFTDVPGNPLLHVVGQLTVLDLDSGQTKTLLNPMPPQTINWSHDGSHLLTTRLYPYSQRYREGLYLPVIVNIESGESHSLTPVADRSVTHASLSDTNQLIYSQDGVLNSVQLDSNYQIESEPVVLFNELADSPNINPNGSSIVFQSGSRLMQMDVNSELTTDITPPLSWNRDQPEEEWILRAGRLFDGTGNQYQTDVDILIRANRIASIGPIDLNTELDVLDASEQTVIPGLFESHAHIGDHNHSEPQGRAWLAYGITSVRDPGSNPYLANERKEAWESARRIGPRTFITGHNMDGNRVFYAVVEGISSDEHLERALLRTKELNLDFIKTYVRMSDTHQRRVVEFAHQIGIPVTSHELLPAAAYGVDHIEHFTGTSRRGYATKISELGRSYQDVHEVLSKSGMGIVPTMVVPGVVLTFSEQDDLYDTRQFNAFYGAEAKQNYQDFMGFFGPGSEGYVDAYGELLSNLIESGALVGTGTDSPFTPFAAGLHAELRLYQREGLAPYQILRAATIDSARIAGVDQHLGSIEAGKLADMVVIDGDPLSQISDLSEISYTIKNGRAYSLDELLSD